MDLVTRVYYNAVFGGLGGLIGWLLFSVFGDKQIAEDQINQRFLLDGALVGGCIGYFVVSVEGLRDRSVIRFVRLATYGVVLGAAGGAAGMIVAAKVNHLLVERIGAIRGSTGALAAAVLARGLGFLFLGMAVGVSEGIAARSLGKLSYGTLGGTLGGFVGGVLFGLVYLLNLDTGGHAAVGGAVGLTIMGACIGSLSALVQGVFQPASVKVMRGWQEGREYPLDKTDNLLGRDEHADIALFRDMKVEKRHALIQREGNRFILVNTNAPSDFTRVNDEPVPHTRDLRDGDRIQLGNVLLRFQARAAQGRGSFSREPRASAAPRSPEARG